MIPCHDQYSIPIKGYSAGKLPLWRFLKPFFPSKGRWSVQYFPARMLLSVSWQMVSWRRCIHAAMMVKGTASISR